MATNVLDTDPIWKSVVLSTALDASSPLRSPYPWLSTTCQRRVRLEQQSAATFFPAHLVLVDDGGAGANATLLGLGELAVEERAGLADLGLQ